ncbi:TIM barrel protein [Streptomyces aurantiacus]|uniref:Putative hydroxypyruvate isomerase n=1 Tax=Streptomyces aurantiacus JA 4570 TaxID=1286094 RepID=S3ZBS2_9ACTN|nr:TIM barrel protein [Streptomyces aurantiacus]EPH41136.1 putative hydroxypyruvate isomerase [Streptomyces aurantiacus JA 4570]
MGAGTDRGGHGVPAPSAAPVSAPRAAPVGALRVPGGPLLAANLKWLFTELDFERRFDAAAEAGFAGVEYADPYPYAPARLRTLLRAAGLRQVLINSPAGQPGSPERAGLACHPGRAADFRAGIERGLEYATELGAGLLHVLAGITPPDVSAERAFATYVTNIAWAVDRAHGTGVRIVVEAQNERDAPGYFLRTQARATAVVEAVGRDRAGLLLDLYHAQVTEGDLVRTLRSCLPYALHLQIADPPDRTEPGTGEIRWPRVLGALRDAGYEGWIGCEYRPARGTVAGLGWVAEVTA